MNVIGYISQADIEALSQLSEEGKQEITITKSANGDNTVAIVAQQDAASKVQDLTIALGQLLDTTAMLEAKSGDASTVASVASATEAAKESEAKAEEK